MSHTANTLLSVSVSLSFVSFWGFVLMWHLPDVDFLVCDYTCLTSSAVHINMYILVFKYFFQTASQKLELGASWWPGSNYTYNLKQSSAALN